MPLASSAGPVTGGPPGRRAGHARASVLAAGLLWGTGGLAGALLGRTAELSPLAVAAYRLGAGGSVVLVVLGLLGRLALPGAAARCRVLLVALAATAYQAAYFAAVALTSVGLATLVTLGAAPILVLAADALRERRPPPPAVAFAVLLAATGLALLVRAPESAARGAPGGVALALVAAAAFAVITLLGRRPVAGLGALQTIGFGFGLGGLLLGPVAALTVGLTFPPSAAGLGLVAFLGVVPTALAYSLYLSGLRGMPAGAAAVAVVLEPLTATALGVLVLGERLGTAGVVGAGLLCAAVLLASLGPGRD